MCSMKKSADHQSSNAAIANGQASDTHVSQLANEKVSNLHPNHSANPDTVDEAAALASDLSMYLRYFGLNEAPFTITPDPRYLFLSRRHQEGLAHLLFGVGQGGSGGFVQLTGEVGTGKTTLCRCLLDQVPEKTQIALILNPVLTPVELLATICDELGLKYEDDPSSKMLMDQLTEHLLTAHGNGERVVVVIDEAQNLSREALEQVRLLTNLETATDKLLQIVLLGQPELRQLLAQNDLRQLAQRITARYHLESLDTAETAAYIKHRMAVAGAARCPFTAAAMKAVYQYAQGVPRLINIIADRALMGAFAQDQIQVTPKVVKLAAQEVQGTAVSAATKSHSRWPLWLAAAAVALAFIVGWQQPWQQFDLDTAALGLNGSSDADIGNGAAGSVIPTVAAPPASASSTEPPSQPASVAESASSLTPLPQTSNDAGIWQRYGALWRAEPAQLQAACSQGHADAFVCLRQSGTWRRLQRLNLPVLLQLEGAPQLLLLGLDEQHALLFDGVQTHTVSREVVDEHWLGVYLAVAPGRQATLKVGESHGEIYRLKSMAAGIESLPYAGPIDERFDPSLEFWVKAFQQRHGLHADGIVGSATRLYLIAEAINEPQLLEEW